MPKESRQCALLRGHGLFESHVWLCYLGNLGRGSCFLAPAQARQYALRVLLISSPRAPRRVSAVTLRAHRPPADDDAPGARTYVATRRLRESTHFSASAAPSASYHHRLLHPHPPSRHLERQHGQAHRAHFLDAPSQRAAVRSPARQLGCWAPATPVCTAPPRLLLRRLHLRAPTAFTYSCYGRA